MKRTLALVASACIATGAIAQTRSSFLQVDGITGVTVTPSNGNLTFEIDVDAAPTFTYQGNEYHITDVFGFWNLSDDDDLTVTNSGFTGNFGPWSTSNSNSGPGAIAGWKSNPNNGITVGGSETFTYSALSFDSVERYGFHVRLTENFPGTSGNTGYVTVVPEPGTMIALGAGVAALIRRRRK